ncbi:hypothetical protein [Oryza sativa Japonica Group]|uniref:Uncharacterized protein n=1 Tax=Oryza sativa subsp. japonica TaxID=39947 RepID=Q5JNI1_ORYSJ|nr:hypothetical protein [Oryza sativa Japonica Group]
MAEPRLNSEPRSRSWIGSSSCAANASEESDESPAFGSSEPAYGSNESSSSLPPPRTRQCCHRELHAATENSSPPPPRRVAAKLTMPSASLSAPLLWHARVGGRREEASSSRANLLPLA